MDKISSGELVDMILARLATQGRLTLTKGQVKAVLQVMAEIVVEQAKAGIATTLLGLGVLVPVVTPARTARSPRTGEVLEIPSKVGLKYRPSKSVKDALNPR